MAKTGRPPLRSSIASSIRGAAQVGQGRIVSGVDACNLTDGVEEFKVCGQLDGGLEVGPAADEDEIEIVRWAVLGGSHDGSASLGEAIRCVEIVGEIVNVLHTSLLTVVGRKQVVHGRGASMLLGACHPVLKSSDRRFLGTEPLGGRREDERLLH